MFFGGPHNETYDLFRELAELHRPAPECARGQMPMLDVLTFPRWCLVGKQGNDPLLSNNNEDKDRGIIIQNE